ncbi:telomere length regulation protein TEL2 homolog [Phalaenopsis equestris]|uniref:telomere length regulation protein TEL2 homolog n=1 Tax=Phalaenopsis equestris TaxID=78828 RepID=UPI0009E4087C|nr:telomere length regulation protein TEL2 homolog [Phalaenopsis equestris]
MVKEDEGTVSGRLVEVELETLILQKVEVVSSLIVSAKHVDQVICALHSLAVRLFPLDSSIILGASDPQYASQALAAEVSNDSERDEWKRVFYHGVAFPAMSKMLIYNVTSSWLNLFSSRARKQVYDSFFVEGPPSEIIQALVPALTQSGNTDRIKLKPIYSNIERLLILCLLERKGVQLMVSEFGNPYTVVGNLGGILKADRSLIISRVAQLLASIPDKATLETLPLLSSHSFARCIVIQLLDGAERRALELHRVDKPDAANLDGSLFFVGETFQRICRRGSADILADEMIPRILSLVQSCLLSKSNSAITNMFEKTPKSLFWLRIVETIKDRYAVERLSEVLLRQLSTKNVNDGEAYWALWLLFNRCFKLENTMRAMFVDKFLLWKVFPVCCLRWIIQFSIIEHAPDDDECPTRLKTKRFLDVVQRLVTVWSKHDFVQSAQVEQQAYITAAIGLCLEKMTNEELETTQDVLSSILQGVSCRLGSPIHLIRKMGCAIALAFSRVVDPAKPLYLDDICCENIDWEFGINSLTQKPEANGILIDNAELKNSNRFTDHACFGKKHKDVKDNGDRSKIKILEVRKNVPDKSIESVSLNSGLVDDEVSDDESKHSEVSSDSSLQPYDLSDDDTDLQKKFSQLADISSALRKPDDPDGIELALNVAEKLIRAAPDELHHLSGDLVQALVHVRCADAAIEGQEDSAEEKRQRALVALIVTCPFESLDILTKLLYSSNVDVSQRLLIIDVMTEAAQELANATFFTRISQSKSLISSIAANQPWYFPSHSEPNGAGPWKEVEEVGLLSWSHRYERVLPSRPGQVKKGKSRRWSIGKTSVSQPEHSKNKFPLYAAAFMLPAMQGYDKRRRGLDLLNRDFIVLGKLIHMLGVCMKCIAMHPEATILGSHLIDMLKSRDVAHHAEAYVRSSALFAASSILQALHPSYVASALIEGNDEISNGLEWIRIWALQIAESDPDTECSTMAMRCLQLHSEMALQTSRSLETAQSFRSKGCISPTLMKDIIIPSSNR